MRDWRDSAGYSLGRAGRNLSSSCSYIRYRTIRLHCMLGIGGHLDVVCQIMKQWTILYSIWYSRSQKNVSSFVPFLSVCRSLSFRSVSVQL